MAIYWSHWQIPTLSAPFFCILKWVVGILLVFDWITRLVNYNCTGGWKAVAQKGFARCKESILHNLKLWAMMRWVLHVREPADWRATFCVGSLTIISIM